MGLGLRVKGLGFGFRGLGLRVSGVRASAVGLLGTGDCSETMGESQVCKSSLFQTRSHAKSLVCVQ